MAVKFDSTFKEIFDQVRVLKEQVELSDEIHMKFIVFFEGESWRENDLTTL